MVLGHNHLVFSCFLELRMGGSHSRGEQLYSAVNLLFRSYATSRVTITICCVNSNDELLSSDVFYLVDSLQFYLVCTDWAPAILLGIY